MDIEKMMILFAAIAPRRSNSKSAKFMEMQELTPMLLKELVERMTLTRLRAWAKHAHSGSLSVTASSA